MDPGDVEAFQIGRWAEAVARSAAGEVVILDGDPFKLWYDLALWRLGHIDEHVWRASAAAARARFVAGDYGFADLILYDDPGPDELTRRRDADTTRARSRFDLHLAMRPFMRAWYEAVDRTDPGRVHWGPRPPDPTTVLAPMRPRTERSAPSLVDAVLADVAG